MSFLLYAGLYSLRKEVVVSDRSCLIQRYSHPREGETEESILFFELKISDHGCETGTLLYRGVYSI